MKKIILILFVFSSSIVCVSQSLNTSNNNSIKGLPTNIFCLNKGFENNSRQITGYIFNLKIMSPQNGLFYDPQYYQQVYFDNILNSNNKKYFVYNLHHYVNDPIRPYGSSKSTLLCGALNYLILLCEKK